MKIYITVDSRSIIRKNYPDLFSTDLAIINIPYIIKKMKTRQDDVTRHFVLSQEIEKRLSYFYKNKRYLNILYFMSLDNIRIPIDQGFVDNFRNHIENMGIFFTEYILIDLSGKVNPNVYKYFDKVL